MNEHQARHFDLTFRYFQLTAINLIDAMQKQGIVDQEKIRQILEEFIFAQTSNLDQYYIKTDSDSSQKYYPSICFRDTELEECVQNWILPDGYDDFHATLPFGVVDSIFEPDDGKIGLTYGNDCDEVNI